MTKQQNRRIRSFVHRPGRITSAQQRALEQYSQRYAYRMDNFDWGCAFPNEGARFVEIGFGMGETLLSLAESQPDACFLGIDVYTPGIGRLFHQLAEREIDNVRVIAADAVEVFERVIPANSLNGVFVFFPDPWPKKRHHKRRLIQLPFAQTLSRSLRRDGFLQLATDSESYAHHMLDVLSQVPTLVNRAPNHTGFVDRPDIRPVTKFERRGRGLGHDVFDLSFTKVS